MQPKLQRVLGFGLACVVGGCALPRLAYGSDYSTSPHWLTPPPRWSQPVELSLVTFNIKDLMGWSTNRRPRMAAIAATLARLNPDVVCLQEAYVPWDLAVIRDALHARGLVHAADFPSDTVGSGLLTFSRFPIREAYFEKFSKGGYYFRRGYEAWAGKGVALCRLEVRPGQLLDVYNTHMVSGLSEDASPHRLVEAREFARFVRVASPPTLPVVMLGDFNCSPRRREHRLMDHTLQWESMLGPGKVFDHIYARSHYGRYRFTRLAEMAIRGEVDVPSGMRRLSDHTGWLAKIRIE